MTTYIYSSLNDGDSLVFDAFADLLSFDLFAISAASVQLTQSRSGSLLTANNKSITLLDINLAQLSAAHISFADGSLLLVGDNSPFTVADSFNNSLLGGPGNDQLIGLAGDDILDGGLGADLLAGGPGNDTYFVDSSLDVVVELADEGVTDTVASSVDYALPSNVEKLDLSGGTNISGTGNELDNVILGSFGSNVLHGGAGNDTIDGSRGNDALFGGTGNDQLTGGSGDDSVYGDAGDDILIGALGVDLLSGGEGNDNLVGNNDGDISLFSGTSGGYAISNASGIVQATDIDPIVLDEGTDSLSGIATLRFSDRDLSLPTEHLVNTVTSLYQFEPEIAALKGGDYIVTWASYSPDANTYDIHAQRFNEYGTLVGAETLVNSTTISDQRAPAVAALSDGGYVIAWEFDGSPFGVGIYAQRFDKDGIAAGVETLVNTTTTSLQTGVEITGLNDSDYVIVWQSSFQDGSGDGVFAQRYDGSGAAVGTEFRVNTATAGNQSLPSVDRLTDGGFIVAWQSGDFYSDIYLQRFDAVGNALGTETLVNTSTVDAQRQPAVASLQNGGFVVAWSSNQDGSGADIYLQRYDGNGMRLGGEERVNTTVHSTQERPSISALIDGGFVVTWESLTSGTKDISAQVFGADGIKVGGELLVNTTQVAEQTSPDVRGLPDGGFLISWSSDHSTFGDIYSQRFDAGGMRVLEVRGTPDPDTIVGGDGQQYIFGLDGSDTLIGGPGGDKLFGETGIDTMFGGTGNDTLEGGGGADTMIGGPGDDIYVVDTTGDVVTEFANEGRDLIRSSISFVLGAHFEDLTLTGTSSINGTGNSLDNKLTGNSSNNVLTADGGNDTLDGGLGADAMYGGPGDDIYVVDTTGDVVTEFANEGRDLIRSSISFVLGAHFEDLTLTGTSSINGTGNSLDNKLTGNSSNNVLTTDGGNDTLDGGLGADAMFGGPGDDTYFVDNADDVVTETPNKGTDTVFSLVTYVLPTNVENLTLVGTWDGNAAGNTTDNLLTGNSANNVLDGGTGHDTLAGGNGDDTLIGGTGGDTMAGGSGNDTYNVDSIGDIVTEAQDEGIDTVQSSISYILGANVENLTLLDAANLDGTGNALANLIEGNAGKNVLDGGAGSDALAGGAGNDILVWDDHDFSVDGQDGTDTLRLDGSGLVLDLTAIANDLIKNVETIDITGSGNNALILGYSDVQDISLTTDTLKVDGNAGDVIQLVGIGTWITHGISGGYYEYILNAVTLLIDRDIIVA